VMIDGVFASALTGGASCSMSRGIANNTVHDFAAEARISLQEGVRKTSSLRTCRSILHVHNSR
jgi:hypothetical protein